MPPVLPLDGELKSDLRAFVLNEVSAGTAVPGHVIGKFVLMRAFAPQRVLHGRVKEEALMTERCLQSEDPVKRTAPEREIVAVNSALGRSGNCDLVELLLQARRAAGRKFQ